MYSSDSNTLDTEFASLQTKVNQKTTLTEVINKIYPVGTIYQSTSNTSPASLFGGTWEKFTNRFLVGAGGLYSVNSMGGEEKHTLTTSEMPRHNHNGSDAGYAFLVDLNKQDASSEFAMLTASTVQYRYTVNRGTAYTGGGGSHNNMPPYYAVNIWRRTA